MSSKPQDLTYTVPKFPKALPVEWNAECERMEATIPALHDFLETWGRHCGAPRAVFRGHLCVMLKEALKEPK